MARQKKQFCPHIYAEWGELFDAITEKERSEILLGITKFPEYEPKNVPIWNFIKSQLQKDYELFVEKCESNSAIIKNYWNKKKQKDTNEYERITNENECIPKRITNNELLLTKTETKTKYGEFQNVLLTGEEYTKLKEIYADKLDKAINKLSSYIASKGKKYKSHYAVLGKHNWVYEEIFKQEQKPKVVWGY